MPKTLSLLDSHEWLGEFWREDAETKRFPGILRYSATEGLTLTTMHRGWLGDDRATRRVIVHGISVDTGPITLFAAWSDSLQTAVNGQFSTSKLRFVCTAAIFGAHYSYSSMFSSCKVVFNNLAEFFHPQGFNRSTPYTREPLLSGAYSLESKDDDTRSEFDVRVEVTATGHLVDRISDLLLIDGATEVGLAQEIDSAVESIFRRHEKESVLSRASLEHVVCLDSNNASGYVFDRYEHAIRDLQGLFSLLFLKMVRPICLSIGPIADQIDRHRISHSVLISLWLTADHVEGIRQDKSQYFGLPTTRVALDDTFPEVLSRWSNFVAWPLNIVYPTLLSRIVGPGDKLQRFILSFASIEQCTVQELGNHKDESIGRFLDRHSTIELREKFIEYLPPGTIPEEIPMSLREIRNCIVHPAKAGSKNASSWIEIINSTALLNISELIYLVLVSYVYEQIGLSPESIRTFRSSISNHMTVYEGIR